jgi:hypothetical protein
METTFDKFITNKPEQRVLFDKEYAAFAYSEQLFESASKESHNIIYSLQAAILLTGVGRMQRLKL